MSELFIIIGLILLNGVFAMSEIALISARKSSLNTDAKKGNRAAKVALKLANEPDRFLSTVQIGITLIGILTGIYSGNTIAVVFGEWLASLGIGSNYAFAIGQTLIVVIVTYLTLIFGELVPKRIGMSVAEKLLIETKLSVSDIASQVGYTKQGKFAEVFRQQFQMNPLDYRRTKKLSKL